MTSGRCLNTCLITVNNYVKLTNSVEKAGLWPLLRPLAGRKRARTLPAGDSRCRRVCHGNQKRPSFDPKSFLAVVGEGRNIGEYRKDEIVVSQGDPADAVFYIERGKVKVTVVSEQGKEAVVAMLGTNDFFGEGCLAGQAQRIATVRR